MAWYVKRLSDGRTVITPNGAPGYSPGSEWVAVMPKTRVAGSNDANARLIAACPEMLEALNAVLEWHNNTDAMGQGDDLIVLDQVIRAIDIAEQGREEVEA